MDNNPAERALKAVALNRKNALFAGSDRGAEHWAVVASLVVVAAYLSWSARRRGGEAAGTGRAVWLADLGSGGVALIGLVSGALLAAPGLDAAAGLVLAVWLFWGGVASLRPAARILTATS
jgi:divalent metal cation (Fe/Co/Zn/Cd) transporter